MIERLKIRLKNNNDRGSSFVLVIVATTFMCVLASALLMGALMTYKLKYYKLNSLNNFYEVEKALDEIYSGVGASVNEHMYSAYTTTAELVVTYDATNKRYTTLDNEKANAMFKKFLMNGFSTDDSYRGVKNVYETLSSYISNQYNKTTNKGGVQLSKNNLQVVYTDAAGHTYKQFYKRDSANGNINLNLDKDPGYDANNIKQIAFKNVCVTRNVELSARDSGNTAGEYIQSITTDIVLNEPEYNVSFTSDNVSASSMYNYAIMADMGIEVYRNPSNVSSNEAKSEITINGNVYASSDYYNKGYNGNVDTKVTNKYDTTPSIQWGSTERSINSGIYVNGSDAKLNLNSDIIVCPGTLGAFNGARISLMGRTQTLSELWTDNIVIGGAKEGGTITASADAYVYDDTELNAKNSKLVFSTGNYYGYSYNAVDTRSIEFLKDKGLATNFDLKSHFSDSAIIVNGEGSTLDLSRLSSLYVAGKSYIEFSKMAKTDSTSGEESTEETTTEETTTEETTTEETTTEQSQDNSEYVYTTLKDYSTGQSIDVKSNQLIFLAQWTVKEPVSGDENKVILSFPYATSQPLIDLYEDLVKNNEVYAVKQTVSGHDYYYLYIDDKMNSDNTSVEKTAEERAKEFAKKYYKAVGSSNPLGLYNVTKYENFKVNLLLPEKDSSINTNGLVTDQKETGEDAGMLYFREPVNVTNKLDVYDSLEKVATNKIFATLLGDGIPLDVTGANNALKSVSSKARKNTTDYAGSVENQTSTLLSYMYINMKDHLSVSDKVEISNPDETDASKQIKKDVNAWKIVNYNYDASGDAYTYDKDSINYNLSPLINLVDYKALMSDTDTKHSKNISKEVVDGQYIIINATGGTNVTDKGDLKIGQCDSEGELKGIIISTGDVRFTSDVKKFTGMIITGGKVIVDHTMTISSDKAMVSSLLNKCAESTDIDVNWVTQLLKNYTSLKQDDTDTDSGMSISDISYEDILVFENWKKNVE